MHNENISRRIHVMFYNWGVNIAIIFLRSYAYYGDFEDFLEFDVAVGQTSITLHNNNLSKSAW